jgi:hypothetical protein
MANEFKVKNGLIVIGDLTTSGTITINGALAATQSWVTSQAYLTSASLSGYATQSYVTSALAALVDAAPAALDTLNELAAALGDDASFSTTITNSIASKLSLSGGTLTGALNGTSASFSSNVTLGNNADLVFVDLAGTFPTSGKGFDWTLNNDGARIYAIQPNSDSIDFVFQLRDNATTNDRFVFWVDEWQGPAYDKYPLIISGGTEFDLKDSSLYTNTVLRLSNSGVLQNVTGNISMFTNNAGYLTSESDTLATVTGRGATTSTNISVNTINIGTDATYGGAYRSVSFGYNGDGSNRIFAANNASDGMYFTAATGQGFNFRPNGGTANLVVINSAGNVGIGTTSPARKLVVNGETWINLTSDYFGGGTTVQISAGGTGAVGIQSDALYLYPYSANSSTSLIYGYNGNASWNLTNGGGNSRFDFFSYGAGTQVMSLTSGGNVGIGTTAPSTKLEVGNFLDAVTNKITVAARYEYEPEFNFRLGQSGTNYDWVGAVISSGDDGNYNGKILFKTAVANREAPTTKMAIKANGNVGIGTVSPSEKLDVLGNIKIYNETGLITDYGPLIGRYNTSQIYIGTGGSYSIIKIGRDDGAALNVLSGGNVGIGTTSPIYKLQVAGSTYVNGGTLFIDSGQYLRWGNSNQGIVGVNDSHVAIVSGGATRQTVYADGRTYFPGLDLSISNVNSSHGTANYFRGDTSHLVIGTGGTLYLNYGGNTTNITGNVNITGGLTLTQGIGQNNLVGRPYAVWGVGGTTTGAIVIKFPGNTSNYGMVHAVIDIYEYGGNTVSTIIVGGHNWNGAWYNYGANLVGQTDKQVRVAVVDGSYAIVIGDNSSSWSYGQVVLRKIQNGSYYVNAMNVSEGYTVTQTASLTSSWISGDLRQLTVSGQINASGGNSSQWNTAYSWGNHATAGYLTSYSETDTLASVTGRGATTTTAITVRGITATKDTNQITINRVDGGGATWQFYSWPGGLNIFPNSQLPIFIGRDGSVTDFSLWNGKLLFENKNAIEGNYDSWLRLNNSSQYASGVYTPGVMRADGGFNVSGSTVWHAGNDGSGSGLDADTVDGVQADSIVYGNARGTNQSITNNNNDLDKTGYYTADGFTTKPSGVANWMYIEHIKLYNDNTAYQKQLGYDTYDDRMWVRTKSGGAWSSWKQIWTSDVFANNSSNWNTAFGWGNHASAGYQPASTAITTSNIGSQSVSYANNAGYAAEAGQVINQSGQLLRFDNRTISPSETTAGYLQFGFTSWANDNSGPYADYLHLRSYTDGSGGNDNLVMFLKSGIGMRIYQQTFGSATAYSSYADVWTSANFTSTNVSNWNTAYGWGNHASAGYLTSVTAHTQAWSTITSTPTTISGYGITNAYTDAQIQNFFNGANSISGYNKSNWDTAYSWGNHASASYATTSYVTTQINNLINGAPGVLDTLDELAAALGDDANFATTVTNSIAGKVSKSGDTITGALTIQNGPSATWDYMTLEHPGPYARINLGNAENGFLIAHEGTTTATFATNGNLTITGALIETSSIKVKENVKTSEGNLEKVVNLRPVTYNKIGSQTTELGLIAEEVAEVYPEFVQYDENGEPIGVHYSRLTAALIGAVKELTNQVQELNKKING